MVNRWLNTDVLFVQRISPASAGLFFRGVSDLSQQQTTRAPQASGIMRPDDSPIHGMALLVLFC